MAERAPDEVHVEGAGDGLSEEETSRGRRPALACACPRGRERSRGEVVPRGVGDDVGLDACVDEHVPAGVGRPEGEVEQQRAIRAKGAGPRQDLEGIPRPTQDLLEVGVEPDVPERALVADPELVHGAPLETRA